MVSCQKDSSSDAQIGSDEHWKTTENVYFDYDEKALFPGGTDAMVRFVGEKTSGYPNEARKNKVEGLVRVKFIIEKDGSINNIEILENPGGGLGQYVVKAVSEMPNWRPAMRNRYPVRSSYEMPMRFMLE